MWFGIASSRGVGARSAVLSTIFLKGSILVIFACLLFSLVHTVCVLFFVKQARPDFEKIGRFERV